MDGSQTATTAAPAPLSFGDELKTAFARFRDLAGMFRHEAVDDIEALLGKLDARLAAVEAQVMPAQSEPTVAVEAKA